MKNIYILLVLVLAFLFVSCTGKEVKEENNNEVSIFREWNLISINDSAVKGEITLLFDKEEGKVSGNGGVNRYFATVALEGEKVQVGIIGSTFMAGKEEMMIQEGLYLETLSNITTFEIIENKLILKGNDNTLIYQ